MNAYSSFILTRLKRQYTDDNASFILKYIYLQFHCFFFRYVGNFALVEICVKFLWSFKLPGCFLQIVVVSQSLIRISLVVLKCFHIHAKEKVVMVIFFSTSYSKLCRTVLFSTDPFKWRSAFSK